jgi:hypothetical protein
MLPADFPYFFCGLPFRPYQVGRKLTWLHGLDTTALGPAELVEAQWTSTAPDDVVESERRYSCRGVRRVSTWQRFGGSASPGLGTGLMEGTLGMRHAAVWGCSEQ